MGEDWRKGVRRNKKGRRLEKVRDLEIVELEEAGLAQSADNHHRLDHGRRRGGGRERNDQIATALQGY